MYPLAGVFLPAVSLASQLINGRSRNFLLVSIRYVEDTRKTECALNDMASLHSLLSARTTASRRLGVRTSSTLLRLRQLTASSTINQCKFVYQSCLAAFMILNFENTANKENSGQASVPTNESSYIYFDVGCSGPTWMSSIPSYVTVTQTATYV